MGEIQSKQNSPVYPAPPVTTIYIHFINHWMAETNGTPDRQGYVERLEALEVPSSIINPSEQEAARQIITTCHTLVQREIDNRGDD
jgi:hypothetical protein